MTTTPNPDGNAIDRTVTDLLNKRSADQWIFALGVEIGALVRLFPAASQGPMNEALGDLFVARRAYNWIPPEKGLPGFRWFFRWRAVRQKLAELRAMDVATRRFDKVYRDHTGTFPDIYRENSWETMERVRKSLGAEPQPNEWS